MEYHDLNFLFLKIVVEFRHCQEESQVSPVAKFCAPSNHGQASPCEFPSVPQKDILQLKFF
jgi:hypothetical protein